MKVLLINPPLGIFNSIYTSIPLLKGQLVGNNIDTDILDFNVEFLREITSPRYLKETKKYLKKIYKNPSILNKDVSQEYHLSEAQILHQRKIISHTVAPIAATSYTDLSDRSMQICSASSALVKNRRLRCISETIKRCASVFPAYFARASIPTL